MCKCADKKMIKQITKYKCQTISTSANQLISTFIFFLFSSCAQVVSPGGGPLDKTAPKVVKYLPDSAQLNFNSKSVQIIFDEYIQLKDLNNQLVISPPLNKTPDINVKSKTLTIDLKDQDLKPNTTYSIYFGNALQDMNENNSKENFRYIFSTGNYIDSLNVKGKVENAFDHKTQKGLLVMIYTDLSDSTAYNNQPDYFTKTNVDGTFEIPNIKAGKYKIVAINDLNGNYKYDGDAESIGFYSDIIDPSTKQEIKIALFQEPTKKIFVKKYFHSQYGKIIVVLNQGTDSIHLTNISNTDKGVQEFTEFSITKDTLIYWVKNYQKDSLMLQVNDGNKIIDTLEFKMITREEALKSKKNSFKLKLLNNFNGVQNVELKRNPELKFVFSQPIASINEKAFVDLKEDTLLMKHLSYNTDAYFGINSVFISLWDSTVYIEDPNKSGAFVLAPVRSSRIGLKENTKYHLFIPPGSFTDIFGLTNDTIKVDFKTREQKYYGSLKLSITISKTSGNYIVQLMDEREHIIREDVIHTSQQIAYEYLHPQKYKLKIIYDSNSNSKWDTGNYLKNIPPEKVLYNSELIMIRSNWDADLDWKIE